MVNGLANEDKDITIYLAKRGFSVTEISNIYENVCPKCLARLANEAGLNWGIEKEEFYDSEYECVFCKLGTLLY